MGMLRGGYYVPVALAFALVARHGRYLPLWLPECGMVAAYASYFLTERGNIPLSLGVTIALVLGVVSAVLAHYALFAGHVIRSEPFAALLRGIGLIVVLDNIASLMSGGYALAYRRLALPFSRHIGMRPVHLDRESVVLFGVLSLAGVMWALVNHTRYGLIYRSVSANRQLAVHYGLAVRKIDLLVMVVAGLLCSIGGLANGLRYGLTAEMMSTTALTAVAVVVAVGYDRLLAVALGMLLVGVLESLCQASIRFSAFEHGISYAVLVVGLAGHYLLWPFWTRWRARENWNAERQLSEANL